MVGLYVISGLEFNLTSIAAILTIVGYSINDTVVVYDRVRENLRKYKKMPIEELLDLSMNQTLSRTILTGVTTLLALIALYLFGGEVIRSFTFAMIFGIVYTVVAIGVSFGAVVLMLREGYGERDGVPSRQRWQRPCILRSVSSPLRSLQPAAASRSGVCIGSLSFLRSAARMARMSS